MGRADEVLDVLLVREPRFGEAKTGGLGDGLLAGVEVGAVGRRLVLEAAVDPHPVDVGYLPQGVARAELGDGQLRRLYRALVVAGGVRVESVLVEAAVQALETRRGVAGGFGLGVVVELYVVGEEFEIDRVEVDPLVLQAERVLGTFQAVVQRHARGADGRRRADFADLVREDAALAFPLDRRVVEYVQLNAI